MIWSRHWDLKGNHTIRMEATVRALASRNSENPRWKQHQPGYAVMGLCFGGKNLHESWSGTDKVGEACWFAGWRDDGNFGIYAQCDTYRLSEVSDSRHGEPNHRCHNEVN